VLGCCLWAFAVGGVSLGLRCSWGRACAVGGGGGGGVLGGLRRGCTHAGPLNGLGHDAQVGIADCVDVQTVCVGLSLHFMPGPACGRVLGCAALAGCSKDGVCCFPAAPYACLGTQRKETGNA
jgi:hypothetical protein